MKCFKHGIHLDIDCIPHSLNNKADYISCIQDSDDWKVNAQLFTGIDSLWDPHTVDCLAHIENTQLPVFFFFITDLGTLPQLQLMLLWLTGLVRLTGVSHLCI